MTFRVFCYWDKGYNYMPSMIQKIYDNNKLICEKFKINLVLLDDNNIYKYITPHKKFKTLRANFKSDIIRYYILDKFGGIWLDTDVIIIKNLNILYNSLLKSSKDVILDVEYENKIGCASIIMKVNSVCSNFCVNYINNYLNSNKPLNWNEIGPNTVEKLYIEYKNNIILNKESIVNKGCNFISWRENPGHNKTNWVYPGKIKAKNKADRIMQDINCYYVITWTIYRKNNIKGNLVDFVFKNPQSVFSYLIEKSIVKKQEIKFVNCDEQEWNGIYIEDEINYKDKNTLSYKKDKTHWLYRYNNTWRLACPGVRVYCCLENNTDKNIKVKKIDLSGYIKSNDDSKNILKIPKIYHQTWKNIILPEKEKNNSMIVKKIYRDYDYKLWCDDMIDDFVKSKFAQIYYFFEKLTMIQKVDIVRYLWMYEYGGVYSDLDILFHKKIEFNKYTGVIFIEREWTFPKNNNITTSIHNCIFASIPKHPIWMTLVEEIIVKYNNNIRNVFDLTGPNSISEIITRLKLSTKYKDVTILPGNYLYQKNFSKESNLKLRHVEHLCYGSWKNNNPKTNLNPDYAVMYASTVNIGDDIQTLAAINFLKKKGIVNYTYVDREKLSEYNGKPITLIMNGWFMHNINKFPPSKYITPIFISVHINNEKIIKQNKSYFKKYEPIGCRDQSTVDMFRKNGVNAYFTGCLTLYFDEFEEKNNIKYMVDINTECDYIPDIEIDKKSLKNFIEIKHDINKNLSIKDRMKLASELLEKYKKSKLVITTRLHCILPCRAFNTDSIFIHKNYKNDPRFSGLKDIINGDDKLNDNKKNINRNNLSKIRNFFDNFKIH